MTIVHQHVYAINPLMVTILSNGDLQVVRKHRAVEADAHLPDVPERADSSLAEDHHVGHV